MRRLIIAGIPPAEAARAARELAIDVASLPSVTELPAPGGAADPGSLVPARTGGGRVVALPGGGPAVRGLARAAHSLDSGACVAILTEALERRGVVFAWDNLMVPVLTGIGEHWGSSGRGVEVEHAFSAAVLDALSSSVWSAGPAVNSRAVLLACAPGELHSLVLWGVAAALAERRIASRNLGACLPTDALSSAVERIGPAAVFVWSQIPGSADPEILADIPAYRPAPTVIMGGPGWTSAPPAGVLQATDLTDTVARITNALGG